MMKINIFVCSRKILFNNFVSKKKFVNEIKTNDENLMNKKLENIIKMESDESIQEKYQEFSVQMKNQENLNRIRDYETQKALMNSKFTFLKIPRIVLQQNFLVKKKKQEKDESMKIPLDIDLNILTNLDFKEPIMLFESDYNETQMIKNAKQQFRIFPLFMLIANSAFYFNFNLLFYQTSLIYNLCYIANTTVFLAYILVRSIRSNALTVQYLHDQKSIKIKRYRTLTNNIFEKIYSIDDLEIFYSDKFLLEGISIRVKKTNEVIILGTEEQGIWHNMNLFESIWGKISNLKPKDSE